MFASYYVGPVPSLGCRADTYPVPQNQVFTLRTGLSELNDLQMSLKIIPRAPCQLKVQSSWWHCVCRQWFALIHFDPASLLRLFAGAGVSHNKLLCLHQSKWAKIKDCYGCLPYKVKGDTSGGAASFKVIQAFPPNHWMGMMYTDARIRAAPILLLNSFVVQLTKSGSELSDIIWDAFPCPA
ncbi:hypothetical protein NPIL_121741 [Nephila pilipes]|uniref:Uncharacterized protein n=1 Tax=Nephila pilipes TaxID=299642 RepID=A0A8X6PRG8_NEPPI|nr:hypothetical protein NPIL_121741 [Nephila pilipes]